MAAIPDPEREFLARRALIERFARSQARRYHLSAADVEDLVSHVTLKFIENTYERLRNFRGESSLESFLATTVANLTKDYIISLWGKWRTSPAAKRAGAIAVLLEVLLVREGLPFDVACQTLWTNHGVTLSREELEAFASKLPVRSSRRLEPVDGALDVHSTDKSPEAVFSESAATATIGARAESVVSSALSALPPQDRLIILMRFRHGRKIVDIARDLGVPAHPLYHRIERLLDTLRTAVVTAGLKAEDVLGLLDYWTPDLGWDADESKSAPTGRHSPQEPEREAI